MKRRRPREAKGARGSASILVNRARWSPPFLAQCVHRFAYSLTRNDFPASTIKSRFYGEHTHLPVGEDADVVAVDGGRHQVPGVLEDVDLVVALLLRSRPYLMPGNIQPGRGGGAKKGVKCITTFSPGVQLDRSRTCCLYVRPKHVGGGGAWIRLPRGDAVCCGRCLPWAGGQNRFSAPPPLCPWQHE